MKLCADELVHGRHEVVLLSRKELLGRPRRGRCTPDTQMNNTPVVARSTHSSFAEQAANVSEALGSRTDSALQ